MPTAKIQHIPDTNDNNSEAVQVLGEEVLPGGLACGGQPLPGVLKFGKGFVDEISPESSHLLGGANLAPRLGNALRVFKLDFNQVVLTQ